VGVEVDDVVAALHPLREGARDPGGLRELVARRPQVGVTTREQRNGGAEGASQQVRGRHVLDVDDDVATLGRHAPEVEVDGGVAADVLVDQQGANRSGHRYQAVSSALRHMPSRTGPR